MPLVNGIESYSIYTQRLSQITVVISGVKSYSMCTLCFITTQKALSTADIRYFFFHFANEL